ncbi:hypothetical protein MY11210_004730 [Beauveria gryllotalpidicola]
MDKEKSEEASFDRLPKVFMTQRALDHFDVRNKHKGAPRLVIAQESPLSKVKHEFASNGGPRLRWMQGASDLKGIPSTIDWYKTMACVSSGERESMVPRYGIADPTVYDANFELYLQQQGIFRESIRFDNGKRIPEPRNLQEIYKRVFEQRNDERPPGLDDQCFHCFIDMNMKPSEFTEMRRVIPTIAGPETDQEVYEASFDNLEPIGDVAFVCPTPDIFDGARCRDLDEDVCKELRHQIIPSIRYPYRKNRHRIVPNWFVEARVRSANTDACKRQICYASAYGARAMHALQNYGRSPDEKVYDGNAYTYSAVYVVESRCLEIFAHHIARAANGQEQYFMTRVCEFNMTESRTSFRKGTNAFRNARDVAREYRDAFIKEANDRAAEQRSRLAAEQRRVEKGHSETIQDETDNSHPSKAEPSSLPEAVLRTGEDVLKRARPDDVVEGDEEAVRSKRRKLNDC